MLIVFSGKRGVGKTTAARYLALNYGFTILSFATKLRQIADFIYPGISGYYKEKPFPGHDWTPREFLIGLGAFMRYWETDYWLNQVKLQVAPSKNLVIDDCRFKNEANLMKDLGGILVRIDRYESENPYKGKIDDPSETELDNYDKFDYRINEVENLTIATLQRKLDYILQDTKS